MTETIDICIATPLPSSVLLTVGGLIDAAWPGAELATNHDGRVNQVIFRIRNRPARTVTPEEAEALILEPEPDGDVQVTSMGPAGVSVLTPADVAANLLPVIEQAFEEFPEAENYLEMPVRDPKSGHRYLLTFCRSAGQTPHELRSIAEAKLEKAYGDCSDAQIREVHRLLEQPRAINRGDTYEDGVRAAMDAMRSLNFGRRSE
ncbi:hypothetical protein [Arthrobacter sp. zg-Y1110]|uniref:hypothetical protein n=1 Tax=Arthrobacter sp. zg-Y1110 TaxID=2886932 RepID=UPI001D139018|nr:hypothetical protein [Arthrobacter sp. zg-Y1110]MCC3292521.1 hypothetical protein [Arthrobacter sp. zg-Y1110]UWX87047.1 hypothetical protein N2K99_16990 [Arthrobacter sp. zg-Y1110]